MGNPPEGGFAVFENPTPTHPFVVSLSNHALGGNQPKATAWFSVEKRGSTGSPRTGSGKSYDQRDSWTLRRNALVEPDLVREYARLRSMKSAGR
jgi:hypothetical protein